MSDSPQVWRNGKFIDWQDATVHVLSHGFSRGSAIFDVFRVHEGVNGPVAFRMDTHIDRLFRSAELLGMEMAYTKDEVKDAALETFRTNGGRQGVIKIMAYWGEEALVNLCPESKLDMDIFVVKDLKGLGLDEAIPLKACISKWRKDHPESTPPDAKACAHYLNGMLARKEGLDRGFDVAIMLDTQGFVAECSIESVFIVKDGVVATAPRGRILQSVSRQTVIDVCHEEGVPVEERAITVDELMNADEAFNSATSFKVHPIGLLEDRKLDTPGPVSAKLAAICKDICLDKIPKYSKRYLTPVY